MNTTEFKQLMQTVADGWNEGNARKAADCFTADAIYIEPPDKQFFQGKEELYTFFGGDQGRKKQMKMTWHIFSLMKRSKWEQGNIHLK